MAIERYMYVPLLYDVTLNVSVDRAERFYDQWVAG